MRQSIDRRPPRVETAIPATLIDSDSGELAVVVTDISSGGFRLRTTEPLVAGEFVHLRVDRYKPFAARLQWIEGNVAGGQFLDRVDL